MCERLIEDAIAEILSGDKQKNALDFISVMKENGFSFDGFTIGDSTGWTPKINNEGIGCISIPSVEKEFWLWLGLERDFSGVVPEDEDMKRTILSHVVIAPQERCSPPYCEKNSEHPACRNRFHIFGIEYESTCHAPLAFFDPDAKTFEYIEKLLLASI